MHEVDVLGQRLAQRPRHRLHSPVRHETAADLLLDQLSELAQTRLELLLLQAGLEDALGHLALVARAAHQAGAEVVEVELTQRAVEVVRPADGAARLHARELGDGHRGEPAELVAVHPHEGVDEHLRELLARDLPTAPTGARLPHQPLEVPEVAEVRVVVDPGAVQREIDVEDGLERLPVVVVLDERRAERSLEHVALGDVDVLDGAHRVEVLRHRDGKAGRA